MLKLGATIFHRITGKEYKIEGFYYRNPRKFLVEVSAHEASMTRGNVLVDFGDERYDTWDNVNSNLYMSEEEYVAMIIATKKIGPCHDDLTIIVFDNHGKVYREKDFVPNPR